MCFAKHRVFDWLTLRLQCYAVSALDISFEVKERKNSKESHFFQNTLQIFQSELTGLSSTSQQCSTKYTNNRKNQKLPCRGQTAQPKECDSANGECLLQIQICAENTLAVFSCALTNKLVKVISMH